MDGWACEQWATGSLAVWVLRTKRHYQVRRTPRVPDCAIFPSHTAKEATDTPVYVRNSGNCLQEGRRNSHRAHLPSPTFSGKSYLVPRVPGTFHLVPRPDRSCVLLLSSTFDWAQRSSSAPKVHEPLCFSDICEQLSAAHGTASRVIRPGTGLDWSWSFALFSETGSKDFPFCRLLTSHVASRLAQVGLTLAM